MALLRAVNLGAKRQVKMADLRDLYAELGLTDVATYLQSGNAVFTSPEKDRTALTGPLESAMAQRYGFEVPTILVDPGRLKAIVSGCPFLDAAAVDPTRVHALFVDPTPDVLDIDPLEYHPEEFEIGEGVIYMHLPVGMQTSRLSTRVTRLTSEIKATSRNWRTVEAVVGMV